MGAAACSYQQQLGAREQHAAEERISLSCVGDDGRRTRGGGDARMGISEWPKVGCRRRSSSWSDGSTLDFIQLRIGAWTCSCEPCTVLYPGPEVLAATDLFIGEYS